MSCQRNRLFTSSLSPPVCNCASTRHFRANPPPPPCTRAPTPAPKPANLKLSRVSRRDHRTSLSPCFDSLLHHDLFVVSEFSESISSEGVALEFVYKSGKPERVAGLKCEKVVAPTPYQDPLSLPLHSSLQLTLNMYSEQPRNLLHQLPSKPRS